jgi:hypothetical protein
MVCSALHRCRRGVQLPVLGYLISTMDLTSPNVHAQRYDGICAEGITIFGACA